MRNLKGLISRAIAFAISVGGLGGCSLSSSRDESSIHIDLSALQTQHQQLALGLSASGSFLNGLTTPPTSPVSFPCYAVNVTGPGIGDTGNHGGGPGDDAAAIFPPLWNETSYCSYRGIVTPPIYLNQSGAADVSLQVPAGDQRLVQVVGVNDSAVCASGVVDTPPGNSGGDGRFFEIGRAKLAGLFGDRSVGVAMNWPNAAALRAARVMDCGNNSCTLIDKFHGVGATTQITGSVPMLAQRINTTAGQFIRSVDLNLTAAANDSAAVTIYESSVGSSVPTTATNYSTSITFSAAVNGAVQFDLENGGNHLQAVASKDYWIVLSGTPYQVEWAYLSGANTAGVGSYDGTNWSAATANEGYDYRVNLCAN